MKSIILAAGKGTRLKPLTDKMPKCLTEVNGKPILSNALEVLDQIGVKETILAIGYLGEKIKERIGEQFGNMKISYIEVDNFDKTSTSYGLWVSLKNFEADDSLLVIEGDIFFEKKLLEEFLKKDESNITVVQKYNLDLFGSFVEVDYDGKIIDWVHRTTKPSNFRIKEKFKTVNIHKFDRNFVETILKPTLKEHMEEGKQAEPIEYVLQDIIKNKEAEIYAFETGNLKWFEIDDASDLKIAEKIFRKKLSLEELRVLYGGYWRYDVLDFHYLVNCHFPTKEFYDKLNKELPALINHYPSRNSVIASFISKWKNKSYFNKDNLIVTNGSSEAIKALNQMINKITVPIPTFNEYVDLPEEKINLFLSDEKNKFQLNIDKLIEEIKKSESDFVVICNPNNPVGNVVQREDMIKLLKTGVNVIVDEAFIDFSVEDSVEDLIERYNNLIIVKTVTKTMGLAGLRLGYVLTTNKEIKEKLLKILPIWNVNSIAEYFAEHFLEYEKEYWDSVEKTKKLREELFLKLKEISFLEPYETKSNFIFCKTKISAKKLADILYEEYNIIIRSQLNQKKLNSDYYIRIGIRTKEDNDKLISVLGEIEKKEINL